MIEIIDCTFFHHTCWIITHCFEDRFVFCLQACFFQKKILLCGDCLHCKALWLISDGYINQDISYVVYTRNKQWNKTEEPTGIAMPPYQHAASNKISRLLAKCDMKTHHLPLKKTTQGKIDLKTPNVCCIPCRCGKVYVRHAGVYKQDARGRRGTFTWARQRIRL